MRTILTAAFVSWMAASWSTYAQQPKVAAGAGYADMRKTTIYGGTTEVQKGIIARLVLGL